MISAKSAKPRTKRDKASESFVKLGKGMSDKRSLQTLPAVQIVKLKSGGLSAERLATISRSCMVPSSALCEILTMLAELFRRNALSGRVQKILKGSC